MKKSTLILLISTAIFFTSTLVLLYLNYLKPTQTFTPTTGTIPTDTPIPTTNPTADWKTYKNEEYGFEVRYPANYSTTYEDLRKIDKNYLTTIHSSDYIVDNKEMVTTFGTSFYYIESRTKSCSEIEKQLISETGFRLVDKTNDMAIFELDDKLANNFPSRQALISSKNSCIQMYCNSSTFGCTDNVIGQEFAQILSTFKFVDQKQESALDVAKKYLDAYVSTDWATAKQYLSGDSIFDEAIAKGYAFVKYTITGHKADTKSNYYYHVYVSFIDKNGETHNKSPYTNDPLEVLMVKDSNGQWKVLTWYFYP